MFNALYSPLCIFQKKKKILIKVNAVVQNEWCCFQTEQKYIIDQTAPVAFTIISLPFRTGHKSLLFPKSLNCNLYKDSTITNSNRSYLHNSVHNQSLSGESREYSVWNCIHYHPSQVGKIWVFSLNCLFQIITILYMNPHITVY